MTRPRTMCASCTQPVANPPSSPAVHGPEDWLCVACAADERRLMRFAGEAGYCPDCDPGSFDEVGRACARHASVRP